MHGRWESIQARGICEVLDVAMNRSHYSSFSSRGDLSVVLRGPVQNKADGRKQLTGDFYYQLERS